MSRIYQIEQPSSSAQHKPLHDIPLEDNAVLLSGYFSDVGIIENGSLFARGEANVFQALYDSNAEDFSSEYFVIGTPIYVYIGAGRYYDYEFNALKVYSSFYEVPFTVNGVEIGNDFLNKFDYFDNVWLQVTLDSTLTRWNPTTIVSTTQLVNNNFYIYLGSCTFKAGAQSQSDLDKFSLELDNKLYYYSNYKFIPFELWKAQNDFLPLSGGTMSGAINMGGSRITNLALPQESTDAASKEYVDSVVSDNTLSTYQDKLVSSLDGTYDVNVAYFWYPQRARLPILGFSTPMPLGKLCHIFVYCAAGSAAAEPGTYTDGSFQIPCDIMVGDNTLTNYTAANNYVWINGILRNGGSTSGAGNYVVFNTPSPKGMIEVSILFIQYSSTQYRTIIKVDAEEVI